MASEAETRLGRKLLHYRKRIEQSGQPLLDWRGLEAEVADRRGSIVGRLTMASEPDTLVEWMYATKGAVRLAGKAYVRPAGKHGRPNLIAAVGYRLDGKPCIASQCDDYERWDGEFIVLPRVKFRDGPQGLRIDQLVCSNYLDNDSAWERYWRADDGE